MALTPDQRAVLELVLAGQSYAELAELLGIEPGDVEERARAGLAALGGADPDRNVGLSAYLLGQADPIARADAVRHLRQDRADHALAEAIMQRLAELGPTAALPKLPPAPGGGRFLGSRSAPADGEQSRRSPLADVTRERGRLYAGLAAAAVILIAVVLAVTGAFTADEPEGANGDEQAQDGGIPDGEELTRIPLASGGGSDASGAAIVGLSTGDQAYLDLVVRNLNPAPEGRAYVVWFMFDERTGYPLSPIFPNQRGEFTDRFAIPSAVTALVARAQAIEVSLSDARETLGQIQQAAQNETFQIQRPGRTVLQGEIQQAPQNTGGASG